MKNFIFIAVVLFIVACTPQKQAETNRVVLAYVTSWSRIMPDTDYVTHINYAFGHVNETFGNMPTTILKERFAKLFITVS